MTELDATDFRDFYHAVNGYAPLPWQQALAEHVLSGRGWPAGLDVPTGLGKTSVIHIAVFAAAAGVPGARRRTFFIVDRRLVVDEAYDQARALAAALNAPRHPVVARVAEALRQGDDPGPVLEVARMRGGTTWSWRWVERPDRHAVVVGTVDQIGSRLLMRGYGLSEHLAPIDAALVGTDSLILCDEAHLSQAFLETADVVAAAGRTPAGHERLRAPQVVALSATPAGRQRGPVFSTTAQDADHPVAGARLHAGRWVHTVAPKATGGEAVVGQMVAWARLLAGGRDSGRVVLVVCNTVARARQVFNALAASGVPAGERALLIGRSRDIDRDHLIARVYPRIKTGVRSYRPGTPPFFVVATQTLEVGADVDGDALVTESCSLSALIQRLGRLGRAPEKRPGQTAPVFRAVVVHDAAAAKDDPVYGPSRAATWDLLCEHVTPLTPTAKATPRLEDLRNHLVASPVALQRLLAGLTTQQRQAVEAEADYVPLLWDRVLRCWSTTSPRPHPDPPVAPYLHGIQAHQTDVQLVWRSDLAPADIPEPGSPVPEGLQERLAAVPPAAEEMITVSAAAVQHWATAQTDTVLADVEGTTQQTQQATTGPAGQRRALRYGPTGTIQAIALADARPGDVLVVPSAYGGCDAYGWNPASTDPVLDVADLALRRDRPRLRLSRHLLEAAQPLPGEPVPHPAPPQLLHDLVADLLKTAPTTGTDFDLVESPEAEEFHPALAAAPLLTSTQAAATEPGRAGIGEPEPLRGPVLRWQRLAHNLHHLAAAAAHQRLRVLATDHAVVLTAGRTGLGSDTDTASSSAGEQPLELEQHQQEVARQAAAFAVNLGLPEAEVHAVYLAGAHHDQGKREVRFQAMLRGLPPQAVRGLPLLAKSGFDPADAAAFRHALRVSTYPPGMRHEALSARLTAHILDHAGYDVDRDLVVHLVATHHGRARPMPTVVKDPAPVEVSIEGTGIRVRTDDLADHDQPARFEALQARYGPWKLALLEAVVRLADIWCSAGHPVTSHQPPPVPRLPRPRPAPGRPVAAPVPLPALDGRDPLGFLAALGALRLLTWVTDKRVRLSFDPATATARLTGPFTTIEEIAGELAAIVARMGPQQILPGISHGWPPPSSSGPDPMRVVRSAYRDLATHAGEAAQPWLSCIATDLAVDNSKPGRCALTQFMAPAGRQNVSTFFTTPLQHLRRDPKLLYEALASWRRIDGYTGEYFDHRAIRGAGDLPSGKATNAGVPGASWLATQALPLLHLTGDGQNPQAALWHRLGRRRVMCWPVWEPELDLAATRALITHPVLTRLRPSPQDSGTLEIEADRLRPLGVIVAAAAERRAMQNSAGPLAPLSVRLI